MSISFFGSPFDLENNLSYQEWRKRKLSKLALSAAELLVEVGDIAAPTPAEQTALNDRIRRCNMAVFQESPKPGRDDKAALMAFGQFFGLRHLDANVLADTDGITPLTVHHQGTRARYIPYTDRPIAWHSDGYYNSADRAVRGLILYCANPAADGGSNRLIDHEALYIQLRDKDPALVAALMRPDAMTIPGNDEEGLQRPDTVGPVFWVDKSGHLSMRYTARSRNVLWSDLAKPAADAIKDLLDRPNPHVIEHRMSAGQGLLCNNVLHTRERFTDDKDSPRLLYRARYYDRISEG